MSTTREARRALARGDTDAALVLLWNAIEPLRLRHDEAGLESVAHMAAAIAEHGDGSQAREAGRLLEATRETLVVGGPRVTAVVRGTTPRPTEFVVDADPSDVPPDVGASDVEVEHERGGRRVSRFVWALVVGGFLVFNVLRGLLNE